MWTDHCREGLGKAVQICFSANDSLFLTAIKSGYFQLVGDCAGFGSVLGSKASFRALRPGNCHAEMLRETKVAYFSLKFITSQRESSKAKVSVGCILKLLPE